MPFPVAAGVAAAASLLGSGAQVYAQGKMNKKTRRWNEKMYGIQRADSISDWHMQNAYNSPEAQMSRYKEAGLNPNLIYGQSNEGGVVRSSSPGSWHPESPIQGDELRNVVSSGYDAAIQQAQLNNLKTQNASMVAEIAKTGQETANLATLGARSSLDLDKARATYDTSIAMAEASLRRVGVLNELGVSQTGLNLLSLDQKKEMFPIAKKQGEQSLANAKQLNVLRDAANARAESSNVADLKIKAQSVLNMMRQNAKTNAEISNLYDIGGQIRRAKTLQDLDIYMKSAGFNWSDPVILRQLRMSSRGYSK